MYTVLVHKQLLENCGCIYLVYNSAFCISNETLYVYLVCNLWLINYHRIKTNELIMMAEQINYHRINTNELIMMAEQCANSPACILDHD